MHPKRLSQEEFEQIYSKVPRAGIDLVIVRDKKVLLTKRSIEPFKGLWHFPGGGIFHRETIQEAASRIAIEEIGVDIKIEKLLGEVEVLHDGPNRHTILLEFKCRLIGDKEPSPISQASECAFFDKVPEDTMPYHKKFLLKNINSILE